MSNLEILNSPARTLVVDDYDPWRRHICAVLKARPGLQVVGEASDGLEAVRMCAELKPDLILLDIGLSNLNGIEVEKRICQLVPSPKVLFLSQDDDAEVVQAALGNGAQGYVLKADAGSELLPAIKAILRGERFVSSHTNKAAESTVCAPCRGPKARNASARFDERQKKTEPSRTEARGRKLRHEPGEH